MLTKPEILLLSSKFDLSCDYVVSKLLNKSARYLRLNSEELATLEIELDPVRRTLTIRKNQHTYLIDSDSLKSVYFRRPVYIRDYGDFRDSPDRRFSKLQWSSFICNLMLFDSATWINNPTATYKAEHKAVQLAAASEIGFTVPQTRITNSPHSNLIRNTTDLAIKGIDTVMIRTRGEEMFGFTTFDRQANLNPSDWRAAPATFQSALSSKTDVRVTVVEDAVFAASITRDGKPIPDDWRLHKKHTQFTAITLPNSIHEKCCELVRSFGLCFGGIDLALCNGEYFFIEINPTGEWAWLVDATGLPIDSAIADTLCRPTT